MRILLVGDPPQGPKLKEHLAAFGDVDLVTEKEFTEVPHDAAWVVMLNGGGRAGRIAANAGKVGAKCVTVAPGWSQAQTKLAAVGFFKMLAANAPPATSETPRPFAALADERARAAQAALAKAEAATRLGLDRGTVLFDCGHVLDVPKIEVEAYKDHTLCPDCVELDRLTRPPEVPVVVDDAGKGVFTDREDAPPPTLSSRRIRSEEKEDRLRQLFGWNPNLSIPDAQIMLAAVAQDGRAIAVGRMSEIRDEVRSLRGLPVGNGVRKRSLLTRARSTGLASRAVTAYEEATGEPEAPAVSAEPTEPPAVTSGGGLPPEVALAARALREACEAASVVGSLVFTYKKNEKATLRWRPDADLDAEV